tara:strand:- start:491 stop:1114 length:624 start_codon:yes stop_codon:yes gene_type:complete
MTETKKFHDAMELVSELNKSHGVTQKGGKSYTEVSTRMEAFRITFGGNYGIETELMHNDGQTVVVRALIRDRVGFVVGSGLAEEIRGSSYITKTSALEVCETSAIGRALASLGLHGGTYASANEMVGVERKQKAVESQQGPANPPMNLSSEDRIQAVVDFYSNGCSSAAFEKFEPKYTKMINSVGLAEDDFDRMVNAHNDRKKELEV